MNDPIMSFLGAVVGAIIGIWLGVKIAAREFEDLEDLNDREENNN